MKKLIAVTALLFSAVLFTPEGSAQPARPWYFAFGLNSAHPHFRGETGELDWKETWGTNIRIGYLVTDFFAFEASYQHFERFKAVAEGPGYRRETVICGQNVTLGGKAYLRLDDYIGLYGTLGVGFLRSEIDFLDLYAGRRKLSSDIESDLGGRAGAGMNIYLYRRLALEIEYAYNWGTGRVNDLRFSSASLQALIRF